MKALVETIAKALVAQPEAIEVTEVASDWEVTVSL